MNTVTVWKTAVMVATLCSAHPHVVVAAELPDYETTTTTTKISSSSTRAGVPAPCLLFGNSHHGVSTKNFTTTAGCDWTALETAISQKLKRKAPDCSHGAQRELQLLTGTDSVADARQLVNKACTDAWELVPQAPFIQTVAGNEHRSNFASRDLFLKAFFDGGTYWNEARQTITADGTTVDVLAHNPGRHIRNISRTVATQKRLSWPSDEMSNFDQCQLNAAMCCWVQDRQANDNNGNCATPYDEKCVNAKPANNGEICYVDTKRSPQSNRVKGGFVVYDGHEGRTHCHGWAWPDNANHLQAMYKANTLFHVSMDDHLLTRGYVRNVPGAPMCACLEQMPTVSRADCTQVKVQQTTDWSVDAHRSSVRAVLHDDAQVKFQACRANERNNDLAAYYRQLIEQGHIADRKRNKLERFQKNHVVGKNNCTNSVLEFMHQQGWTRSKPFDQDEATHLIEEARK